MFRSFSPTEHNMYLWLERVQPQERLRIDHIETHRGSSIIGKLSPGFPCLAVWDWGMLRVLYWWLPAQTLLYLSISSALHLIFKTSDSIQLFLYPFFVHFVPPLRQHTGQYKPSCGQTDVPFSIPSPQIELNGLVASSFSRPDLQSPRNHLISHGEGDVTCGPEHLLGVTYFLLHILPEECQKDVLAIAIVLCRPSISWYYYYEVPHPHPNTVPQIIRPLFVRSHPAWCSHFCFELSFYGKLFPLRQN